MLAAPGSAHGRWPRCTAAAPVPRRYRTQLCSDGSKCPRKICFFAHSLEELRTPETKPWVAPDAVVAAAAAAAAERERAAGSSPAPAGSSPRGQAHAPETEEEVGGPGVGPQGADTGPGTGML